MRKLSKNQFTSAPVKDHMSPHGITESPDQSSQNSRNKFQLARPLMRLNFIVLRQKMCQISIVEKFCSRKSRPKFNPVQKICHESIGCTRVSIDTLCNFCSRLLCFRDINGFVSQMPLLDIPPHLSPS